MEIAGIGRVIFWAGGSLWIGRALAPTEFHSHHAIQTCVGLSGCVEFRTTESAPWDAFDAAVISPDVTHTFRAPGRIVASLFCEPESALGRALLARFGPGTIGRIPPPDLAPHVLALRSAFDAGAADEELEQVALDMLYALSLGTRASLLDPRIARVTRFIVENLSEPLALDAAARHVGLSAGRFRHLFVEETGIPFRAYLLWTRLNRAIELGFGGMSWTDAAHATGFADSAHLSRTMRRMYGLAPSSIRPETPAVARLATA